MKFINEAGQAMPVQPYPLKEIFDLDTPNFMPALELWAWINAVVLNEPYMYLIRITFIRTHFFTRSS